MNLEPPFPNVFAITGGRIFDGTGQPPTHADLVVNHSRIELRPPGSATGMPKLDVDGLAVAPGFIDAHSHADLEPFSTREARHVHTSRLLQGVTTEVTGNCGFSPFPVAEASAAECTTFLGVLFGASALTFPDLDTYSAAIEAEGLACNIAPLVGHGTLRASAIGVVDRLLSPAESADMQGALVAAMSQGAFGLSTGLCYSPATFADSAEVAALAEVATQSGGIYATHVRNETDGIWDAVQEALDVGRSTGGRLHISHLKLAGRRNWGGAAELLAVLDRARAEGIDVTADAYPYTAGSTMLHSLLPPWLTDQGIEAMLSRLADPTVRRRVAQQLIEGVPGWQNLGSAAGWDRVTVASSPLHPEREGRSVAELRNDSDENTADTIARLLLDEGGRVVAIIEAMHEDDVVSILGWPHMLIGSDGIPLPGTPHPRLTGTFPRVLGRYRQGSLESAVKRMTGDTAARFGIPDRGTLKTGAVADIVVIDPETVSDRGTYADPWLTPAGIHHVFLAGRPAVWDSQIVDETAGVVLKRV
jgi:N-acyl-D-amino-acid deacylase